MQTGVPGRTRWRRCTCCTRRRTEITRVTKLQRVKATHGACSEHSMTHLARYPATDWESHGWWLCFLFRAQSRRSSGIYCFDAHIRRATPTLEYWTAVTAEEIQKLISSAPNKTRELDPAPTWQVKDMRGLLSPFISLLFNKSLTSGIQGSFSPAAVEESWARCRWPEELSACLTCHLSPNCWRELCRLDFMSF